MSGQFLQERCRHACGRAVRLAATLLLILSLSPVSAFASQPPTPAATPSIIYTLGLPLLVDSAGGRLYATVFANGQASHIGVYATRDGRLLTTFPYSQPFALDAKGSRLFLISGRDQITVLNTRTGKTVRTLRVDSGSPATPLTVSPSTTPRRADCWPLSATPCW